MTRSDETTGARDLIFMSSMQMLDDQDMKILGGFVDHALQNGALNALVEEFGHTRRVAQVAGLVMGSALYVKHKDRTP